MSRKRVFIASWQIREGIRLVYRFRPLIPDITDMVPLEHMMLQHASRTIRSKAVERLTGLKVEDEVIRPALLAFMKEELEQIFKGDDIEVVDEATVESRLEQGVYAERPRTMASVN